MGTTGVAPGSPETVEPSPPHSLEAERALLGGLIRSPKKLGEIREIVQANSFFSPQHRELYKLLVDMVNKGEEIDTLTVPVHIGKGGKADRYGGLPYVLSLPEKVPSTSNLEHYARVVAEKSVYRAIIVAARSLGEAAFDEEDAATQLLDRATKLMLGLGKEHAPKKWADVSVIVDDEIVRIQERAQNPGAVTGTTTGFIDLDKKLAGLQPTDLLILAARPAMGKTALALNIAQKAADSGAIVGVFSLEMSRGQLVTRMFSSVGTVDATKIRTGTLDEQDWVALNEATEAIRRLRICIDDTPGLTITQVTNKAKRLKEQEEGLDLIIIDYLQLMQGDDARAPREQQISATSRGLKGLAKELNVPVIALSQLNRGVESRQNKRPVLSDLRESGAIEQDADIIMFLYRDDYYNPDDSPDEGLADVIIAKHRNGPTGTVQLVFEKEYSRFQNYLADDLKL